VARKIREDREGGDPADREGGKPLPENGTNRVDRACFDYYAESAATRWAG
jgi:hypothetical protein